jgi:hypothetical protein
MHLKPGVKEWFMFWLEREHPQLVERYLALYGDKAYAPVGYRKWLAARIKPLIARHGLVRGEEDPATGGVRSSALGSFALGKSALDNSTLGDSARGRPVPRDSAWGSVRDANGERVVRATSGSRVTFAPATQAIDAPTEQENAREPASPQTTRTPTLF